jgi:hypothetical protein
VGLGSAEPIARLQGARTTLRFQDKRIAGPEAQLANPGGP